MFRTAILAASAAAILTASGCAAARQTANEVAQSAPAAPAASVPAGKPACQGDVIRIGWYAETDCDVQPPQRLDLVLVMTDVDSLEFVNELRRDCANHGGTYGEDSIRDEYLCHGIDY